MAGEDSAFDQILGDLRCYLFGSIVIQVVALVLGILLPVNLDVIRHQVHVIVFAFHLPGVFHHGIVTAEIPVLGAWRADEDQLSPDFITCFFDPVHAGPVDGQDFRHFIRGRHVVFYLAGFDRFAEAEAFIVICPGINRLLIQFILLKGFPPVMIAEDIILVTEPGIG